MLTRKMLNLHRARSQMSRNRDRTLALLANVSPLGCSCCRESRDGQDSAFLCFRCCCCYCCFVSFYCRSQHHFFFCSKILHFWLTSRHSAVAARKVETDKDYHVCFVYFVVVVLSVIIGNYFLGKILFYLLLLETISLAKFSHIRPMSRQSTAAEKGGPDKINRHHHCDCC